MKKFAGRQFVVSSALVESPMEGEGLMEKRTDGPPCKFNVTSGLSSTALGRKHISVQAATVSRCKFRGAAPNDIACLKPATKRECCECRAGTHRLCPSSHTQRTALA
jgi:hypothetical protein